MIRTDSNLSGLSTYIRVGTNAQQLVLTLPRLFSHRIATYTFSIYDTSTLPIDQLPAAPKIKQSRYWRYAYGSIIDELNRTKDTSLIFRRLLDHNFDEER